MEEVSLQESTPRQQPRRWNRYVVALQEMLRKRLIIAGRDLKDLVFQLLLPVAAICMVLAILKINIDPSSPTITLNFMEMLQGEPVALANAPNGLSPCIQKGSAPIEGGTCASGLHFRWVMSFPVPLPTTIALCAVTSYLQ
jgi:hypothetical protein